MSERTVRGLGAANVSIGRRGATEATHLQDVCAVVSPVAERCSSHDAQRFVGFSSMHKRRMHGQRDARGMRSRPARTRPTEGARRLGRSVAYASSHERDRTVCDNT